MPIKSFRPVDVSMDDLTDGATHEASFLPGATCSIGRAKYHDIVLNSPHISTSFVYHAHPAPICPPHTGTFSALTSTE